MCIVPPDIKYHTILPLTYWFRLPELVECFHPITTENKNVSLQIYNTTITASRIDVEWSLLNSFKTCKLHVPVHES